MDNVTLLDSSGNSNPVTQPPTHPPTPTIRSAHLGSIHHDLADDDTPASNSHEAEATAFAEAIGKVLKSNDSSKAKLWEPMVPTPVNFALLFYSANSTSEIAKIYSKMIPIRSIMSYHS